MILRLNNYFLNSAIGTKGTPLLLIALFIVFIILYQLNYIIPLDKVTKRQQI